MVRDGKLLFKLHKSVSKGDRDVDQSASTKDLASKISA